MGERACKQRGVEGIRWEERGRKETTRLLDCDASVISGRVGSHFVTQNCHGSRSVRGLRLSFFNSAEKSSVQIAAELPQLTYLFAFPRQICQEVPSLPISAAETQGDGVRRRLCGISDTNMPDRRWICPRYAVIYYFRSRIPAVSISG